MNKLIKQFIHPDQIQIVVVTPDAAAFKKELSEGKCEVHYPEGMTKPDLIRKEDAEIAAFKVGIPDERIRVISSESLFEN